MRPQFFRETSQTQEKLEKNQTNKQTNKECVNFQNQMGFGNIQEDATKDQENSTRRRRRKQARTQKQPMNQIRNQATKERKKTQRTKNNEISGYG